MTKNYQLSFDDIINDSDATDVLSSIDDTFPIEFADLLASQEVYNKHLFRPNTYLHKWWARRCGTTFRAILKQFASESRRDYYSPRGLEGKVVLDPMMGGGTTVHEAIRLGANVIGADIDPIPVMQLRSSLTQMSFRTLKEHFDFFFESLYESTESYFKTECQICKKILNSTYTLYGVRKKCSCNDNIVQIDQYILRQESGKIIYISPDTWTIEEGTDVVSISGDISLIVKSQKKCPSCGESYRDILDLPYYSRLVPIAICLHCPKHGIQYQTPTDYDLQLIASADSIRNELDFGSVEDFLVEAGPKTSDLLRRGINSYLDLFSSRQLLYLHSSLRILEKFDEVPRMYISLLISTSLEFNSLLCGYKGWQKRRAGAIRHVFTLHAFSFPYTVLENNPVNRAKSSGNLQLLFRDRIERARQWAENPVERHLTPSGKSKLVTIHGEKDMGTEVFSQSEMMQHQTQAFWLIHGDSCELPIENDIVDIVVTDPPYFDSVQYSNLAMYFRVWLRKLLPNMINWTYDESNSAVANKQNGGRQYLESLAGIFSECNRVLKDSGRLVFTYHHWDSNAWADLTLALSSAKFRLVSYYVILSEHPISVHINNLQSIKHDSILVFRSLLSNHKDVSKWMPVTEINTIDSRHYCDDCARTLGWLLDSDLDPHKIRNTWKELIN